MGGGGPSAMIRNQCPNATPGYDGLMSAEQAVQVAALAASVLITNSTIVVDNSASPVVGSVPTIKAALESGANNIQLKNTGTNYQFPTGNTFLPEPVGDVTPIAISGPLSPALVSGTETAGGNTGKLTDTGLAMTPGAHRGQFARVTSGSLIGSMECIVDNDATSVSLQSSIGVITVGAKWEIVTPLVTVEFPDTAAITVYDGTLGFAALNLLDPNGDAEISFLQTTTVMQTCTLTGFFGQLLWSNSVIDTNNSDLWSVLGAASPFAGLADSIYVNNTVMILNHNTIHSCKIVGDNLISLSNQMSFHGFQDVNIRGADIEAFNLCAIRFQNNGPVVKSTLDGDAFGAGSLVYVDVDSTLYSSPSQEIVMKNSSGSALVIDRGSYARPGFVSGTGNGFVGIELNRMGRCTTANSTVTGTSGNVAFDGDGAIKAYGQLPYVDTVGLSQAAVG